MLKTGFDKKESSYSSNHKCTPLHNASDGGYNDIVKYLIDSGAEVNSLWYKKSLKDRTNVFTLINNFCDPFYQRFEPRSYILIENGMI